MAKKSPRKVPPLLRRKKPPHNGGGGGGGGGGGSNKWEKDTTARLIALQNDVDDLQHRMDVMQNGIDGLHVVTQKIKATGEATLQIVTDILRIVQGLEEQTSNLNSVTAHFSKIA